MEYTIRDISSKRKGTASIVLIRKKTIEDLNIFNRVIIKFNEFTYLPGSQINIKYFAKLNTSKTEQMFDKVRMNYYKDFENKFKDLKEFTIQFNMKGNVYNHFEQLVKQFENEKNGHLEINSKILGRIEKSILINCEAIKNITLKEVEENKK